jgi:hypothetical protein
MDILHQRKLRHPHGLEVRVQLGGAGQLPLLVRQVAVDGGGAGGGRSGGPAGTGPRAGGRRGRDSSAVPGARRGVAPRELQHFVRCPAERL